MRTCDLVRPDQNEAMIQLETQLSQINENNTVGQVTIQPLKMDETISLEKLSILLRSPTAGGTSTPGNARYASRAFRCDRISCEDEFHGETNQCGEVKLQRRDMSLGEEIS